MPKGFTEHEQEVIGKKLIESAQKHASLVGMRRTSIDQIASDAGISKPMFYKFYETKEHLFLKVLEEWHHEMIALSTTTIQKRKDLTIKERLVECILTSLRFMDERSMNRFLSEDVPYITRKIPEAAQELDNRHEALIRPLFEAAEVNLKVDFDLVSTIIHILLWSCANKDTVGERFYDAAELLAKATIEQVVNIE